MLLIWGKVFYGIFTGKFENISQVENVVKEGGLLDAVSDVLEWGINKAKSKGVLKNSVANTIEKGKDTVLNIINNNIEKNLTDQTKSIENIEKYIVKWNNYYKKEDFNNMDKVYNSMEKELRKIMPLENIIKKARYVENIHEIIKNRGGEFNLTEQEKMLAEKLL